MNLNLKHNFTEEIPSDPIKTNTRRQVNEACFSYVTPKKTSNPKLIHVAKDFSEYLGFTNDDARGIRVCHVIRDDR